jgi:hypothetical protein
MYPKVNGTIENCTKILITRAISSDLPARNILAARPTVLGFSSEFTGVDLPNFETVARNSLLFGENEIEFRAKKSKVEHLQFTFEKIGGNRSPDIL